VREQPGVYRIAGHRLSLVERVCAATVRAGGVASHETAAQLWGFERFDSSTLHISVAFGQRSHPLEAVVIHHTRRDLKPASAVLQGVRVTRPPRTALDLCGRGLKDDVVQGFIEFCVAGRLVQLRTLERFVGAPRRGVDGTRQLRRLVSRLTEMDSVAEGELLRLLLDAGIETPVSQFTIRESGRLLARVDFAWPASRVALELDGYAYHADYRTFVHDRERGSRVVAAGWALLRTTPSSMSQAPHQVVEDVRRALAKFGRRQAG
jgi:very-short-patch-repair endonuclease